MGRITDAQSNLKRVTGHNPRDPDAWFELGEIATENGEDEEAHKKQQSLEAQEAAIKAQISKDADAYGAAQITTAQTYER